MAFCMRIVLFLIVGIILTGCGAGSTDGASTTSSAPSASSSQTQMQSSSVAVQTRSAPLGWEAHPPVHVHHFSGTSPSGYSPTQVRHAYTFDQITAQGAGQTVAIVDAYGSPTIQNDLSVFSSQYGLSYSSSTLTVAYATSKPTRTDAGWALETSLDVEWVHAIAPSARILLVVARTASLSDLFAAIDYANNYVDPTTGRHVGEVSMSWGGQEFSSEASFDTHFTTTGVSYFASSGDSGSGVLYPAASPRVVGVGGTSLQLDRFGNVLSETAWSGSGGGKSSYESEPAYQTEWQTSGRREVPDVSYDADPSTGVPVYDTTSYQGQKGWFQVGGTSAGSPQWAALMALVNCQRASALTQTDGDLYQLGSPGFQTTNYRDIVSGSNGGFNAATGYDMVTGLGSPLSAHLVSGLLSMP